MNIANLVVREGLVAQKKTTVPQLIQVSITTADIDSGIANLEWHNLTNDGKSLVEGDDAEPTVTAQVLFGHAGDHLSSWVPTRHLVQSRIDALAQLADAGVANRFSHGMAYILFANNLVDCKHLNGPMCYPVDGKSRIHAVSLTTSQTQKSTAACSQ